MNKHDINSPLLRKPNHIFELADSRNLPNNIECKITDINAVRLLPQKLAHLYFAKQYEIQQYGKSCAEYCRVIVIDPKNEALLKFFEPTNNINPVTENSVNENNSVLSSVNEKTSKNYIVNRKVNKFPKSMYDQQRVYEFLCRYVIKFGITPPVPTNKIHISGCLKRLVDNRWWKRSIQKLVTQANESAAITANVVSRTKQIYASNITTRNYLERVAMNRELLSSHFIINDAGQRFSLQEISDVNVSNPEVRKAELINRARGFEDLAESLGHEALFITITCPSKYHSSFSKSGARNPKWAGYMPDDSQRYLNKQWQKIRAELKRKDIQPYGFRVVEPQHDGTPHWHCLFFVKPEQVQPLENIIRFYSLQVDGDEKGAIENRCDFKRIDPEKGSATGYILKYIVKNIDGKGLGEDKFGNDAITVAKRIKAWASCWCIRQFQQIGGASVSVWRELRRLKEKFFPESAVEKARVAADTSDWQGYIVAMGGIESKPKSHPIKLHYDVDINTKTGECSQSYYDGELVTKIKGLLFEGKAFITRTMSWRLERVS
jgi:hypothetical protein